MREATKVVRAGAVEMVPMRLDRHGPPSGGPLNKVLKEMELRDELNRRVDDAFPADVPSGAGLDDPSLYEKSWYALGEYTPITELSEEEAHQRHMSLLLELVLLQVRLQLCGKLYDSPLLYTNKGLDPTVDKQCHRLAVKLRSCRTTDPQKLVDIADGFLFSFRQKGFKF